MNLSRWSTLVVSVSALALSGTASAHVFPTPQVIASQSIESVTLDVPNERDKPMTASWSLPPAGVEIERAHPAEGWTEEIDDRARAGGRPPDSAHDDEVGSLLKAATEPGKSCSRRSCSMTAARSSAGPCRSGDTGRRYLFAEPGPGDRRAAGFLSCPGDRIPPAPVRASQAVLGMAKSEDVAYAAQ